MPERISPTPTALTDEQLVNSETSGEQDFPSVAALGPDRGFVVVWQSGMQGSAGTTHINGKLYDSHGVPVINQGTGSFEFQIDPASAGGSLRPSVAALSDDRFVVTWTSPGGTTIYGRLYRMNGHRLGSVFPVSPIKAVGSVHGESAVAGLASGGFVVTWTSDMTGPVTNIHGQIFDPDGEKLGSVFGVNTVGSPDYAQEKSAVAGLQDGGFVVAWQSDDHQAGKKNIYMKRFSGQGDEESPNVLVNTNSFESDTELSEGNDLNPSVAALSDGGFVVTWADVGNTNVQGKRYDANGATSPHPDAMLDDFKIGDQAWDTFLHNDVAGVSSGGFVATWVDTSLTSNIYGQRFNVDGVAIGTMFSVSDPVENAGKNEKFPRVVELGDGTFAFVWVGVDSTSSGTTSFGIFSRLFALPTSSPEV